MKAGVALVLSLLLTLMPHEHARPEQEIAASGDQRNGGARAFVLEGEPTRVLVAMNRIALLIFPAFDSIAAVECASCLQLDSAVKPDALPADVFFGVSIDPKEPVRLTLKQVRPEGSRRRRANLIVVMASGRVIPVEVETGSPPAGNVYLFDYPEPPGPKRLSLSFEPAPGAKARDQLERRMEEALRRSGQGAEAARASDERLALKIWMPLKDEDFWTLPFELQNLTAEPVFLLQPRITIEREEIRKLRFGRKKKITTSIENLPVKNARAPSKLPPRGSFGGLVVFAAPSRDSNQRLYLNIIDRDRMDKPLRLQLE